MGEMDGHFASIEGKSLKTKQGMAAMAKMADFWRWRGFASVLAVVAGAFLIELYSLSISSIEVVPENWAAS